MKIKKVSKYITAASMLSVMSGSVFAAAPEFSMPKLTMFSSLGVLNVEDKDYDPEAFEIEVGVKGLVTLDEFKLLYFLNADVADAVNSTDTGGSGGESDIHIKDAKVVIPTQYGAFVLAPRTPSGQLSDLYGPIDIFEYNETHASDTPTGMAIFGQASEGQDVIAYVSPTFSNIKAVAAMLSIREDNDNEVDVQAYRVFYDDKKLHLGAGLVVADQSLAGVEDDYKRTALSAGYRFSKLDLGATYEINKDTFGPAGDYDSYGATARYHIGDGLSVATGYFEKDSEVDANDNEGVVFQVKKEFSPNVAAWAETGQYDNSPDNLAIGLNIQF